MPDNSVDSLVTDPPAGIAFMGKSWDSAKGGRNQWIAWMKEIMQECLRVMKPGAHGLVWALPRTSHWTATALEDAGFEVRDVVNHVFGSGFPKSLNISKAIDKMKGAEREVIGEKTFADGSKARKTQNLGINVFNDSKSRDSNLVLTAPSTPEAKQWDGFGTALKPAHENWILVRKRDIQGECEELALSAIQSTQLTIHGLKEAEVLLARTVAALSVPQDQKEKILLLGKAVNGLDTMDMLRLAKLVETIDLNTVSSWKNISDEDLEKVKMFTISMVTERITESKTLSSYQSQITQENIRIKSENIILIRKPLECKTVAENVLEWGCGGINIDTSRVPGEPVQCQISNTGSGFNKFDSSDYPGKRVYSTQGRFPANFILSHNDDCELLGEKKVKSHNPDNKLDRVGFNPTGEKVYGKGSGITNNSGYASPDGTEIVSDYSCTLGCSVAELDRQSGVGASRFFYIAKASKSDKGEFNIHPTCKNTKLMSYLITLVTPPQGIVLDPFMGSGSTGIAALRDGFDFIGIEKESEYFEIAAARIKSNFIEFKEVKYGNYIA